jgi:CheY-like chemotaxis protein
MNAEPDDADHDPVTLRSPVHQGRAQRVLVVDDFDDNRVMYAEFLSYSGFEVEQACDGEEALAQTQRFLPDVVVMDLALPVVDGWEATRRLKADPATRHIPVIALTGHALDGHWRVAREAGCDAFLAKPCLPERLLETIRAMIAGGVSPDEWAPDVRGP